MNQVEKSHYDFARYMYKGRWISVWHQLTEIIQLNPAEVLEIGPGSGVFAKLARDIGLNVETMDSDSNLDPDHVGSVTSIPFDAESYDVVCAFQVLEHLPYESSLLALREMVRVSKKYVVISLPDAAQTWRYQFHIPKVGAFDFVVPKPFSKRREHTFDGEHYWEINKRNYELSRILKDFHKISHLVKRYRVTENPYHHFFVFQTHRR